jgi:hypothetical protein
MATVSGTRVQSSHSISSWRVPRTRGAASGVLVLLLGAWGALVPFIGPRFGYAYTPNSTWTMTEGRLWLEVVPGAVAVLGGLILIGVASRAMGLWAGWLTALAGAWFAVGPIISKLWTANGQPQTGTPVGTTTMQAVIEQIGFFTGLGVVIVFLAAAAIGRFSVIGVRDGGRGAVATEPVVDEDDTRVDDTRTGRSVDTDAPTEETTRVPVNETTGKHKRVLVDTNGNKRVVDTDGSERVPVNADGNN